MKKSMIQYLVFFLVLIVFTFVIAMFKGKDTKVNLSYLEGMNNTARVQFTKEDYQDKNLVVYFWATWCGVCKMNNPILKFNYSLFGSFSNLKFISVEEGETEFVLLEKYISDKQINYPVYVGSPSLLQDWGIRAFPTTFFINKKGEVKFVDTGIINPISFYLRILFTGIL